MARDALIEVKQMNPNRFQAYLIFTRMPVLHFFAQELQHYSSADETLIGVVLLDKIDSDYAVVILARDENNQYKTFDAEANFDSFRKAEDWLINKIRWHMSLGIDEVPKGRPKKSVNLFTEIVSEGKLHPFFKILKNELSHSPARELLLEIETFFLDIDGNFIEQFQTLGFDARLWELYLFCFLSEENFNLVREHNRPDFLVEKNGVEIAIEAAIVARKKENPPKFGRPVHKTTDEVREENRNNMPLRFGSTLFSKLSKEYWNLPHVQGKPLVIAIADFHDEMSMIWSFPAIIDMLYGYKHNFYYDATETLIINPVKIEGFTKPSGAKVPPGFFFQPGSENISGVLFSATATIAKFNRIGMQAGFGSDLCKIFRIGTCHRHDPNASAPQAFAYEVNDQCEETWGEGMSMYHNPQALHPIDKELFPSIAHHYFREGQIHSIMPDFFPYFSINYNITPEKERS